MDRTTVLLVASLIPSVILHEVSHGAAALALGDDTARRAGRLSLNPVRHVDPVGTILVPVVLAFTSLGVLGWAKPVPVDPRRLRNPRQHTLYVALAGPATNLVLAGAAAAILRVTGTGDDMVRFGLFVFGFVNVVLAALNLVPVPPLDGSALIERVLPRRLWAPYLKVRPFSVVALFALVLLAPGWLDACFRAALDGWERLV